jgi:RNA polymerase sigma-70 factor (ECF subfamily)
MSAPPPERPVPAEGAHDWRTVYDALADDLLRYFSRRVDDATAHDLRQETFLRLHQQLDTLSDDEHIAAWTFRVARNLLIDHHRRQRPAVPVDPEAHADAREPVDDDDDVSAQVASWLPAFVALLDAPTREALELAELEGLTQREVAARLGLSTSGAKSRVQRGRHKLREALEACCEIERDVRGHVTDYRPRDPCSCQPQ